MVKNTDYASVRVWKKTLPKLKLLAALRGTSIVALIDHLVTIALAEYHEVKEKQV